MDRTLLFELKPHFRIIRHMNLLLENVNIVDPSANRNEIGTVCLENGILKSSPSLPESDYTHLAGHDLLVTPGFIDIHVHFRAPGGEDSETIETGSRAAARGGFTDVVTMPNTNPPIDTPELVRNTIAAGERAGLARIHPSACATTGRGGAALSDLSELKAAGAACFTDDGSAVSSSALMKTLLLTAADLNIAVMQHAVDPDIAGDAVIRKCALAAELQLPVFDPVAETRIVERDISLAHDANARLHIQHISTAGAVGLLRDAKRRGISVTSEATPHHLALSVEDIPADDANYKMNPPLGNTTDRKALIEGVLDGTITCFATDHAPHSKKKKSQGFTASAFGVIGLESAAAVTYDLLVATGKMSVTRWVEMWTTEPARVAGIAPPALVPDTPAGLAVFRTGIRRQFSASDVMSKSQNTPFFGRPISMDPIITVCNGFLTWLSSHS